MLVKKLNEIAWNVSEKEYRKDHALSYSSIAKYEREGFNALIGEQVKTSSLTYGSVVDCIVTDGMDCYNDRYIALSLKCSSAILSILIDIAKNSDTLNNDDIILQSVNKYHYCSNWKDTTRISKIKAFSDDFELIKQTIQQYPNKEIIHKSVYDDAIAAYNALLTSENTKDYFDKDTEDKEHYYQLKFKGFIDDVDYRCMADLILVYPKEKIIVPCDLKTTGHPELMFWESFHKWYYFYQAKLYWNLIRQNLDKDEYFKDFELKPYKFIVVNKTTLNPMVYEFKDLAIKEYTYNGITYRNVSTVGKELRFLFDKRKEEMNKKLLNEALDKINQGLAGIKTAISEEEKIVGKIDQKVLAKAIANTYKTNKPEYGADALYKNMQKMASSDKIKIILKWLDASNLDVIKEFRKLPIQEQSEQAASAVNDFKVEIIDILKNKFEA